jgi:hypothetical protein
MNDLQFADKILWTSNKPAQWTLYICKYNLEKNNYTDPFQNMSLLDQLPVSATTRQSGSILISHYNISFKMAYVWYINI